MLNQIYNQEYIDAILWNKAIIVFKGKRKESLTFFLTFMQKKPWHKQDKNLSMNKVKKFQTYTNSAMKEWFSQK